VEYHDDAMFEQDSPVVQSTRRLHHDRYFFPWPPRPPSLSTWDATALACALLLHEWAARARTIRTAHHTPPSSPWRGFRPQSPGTGAHEPSTGGACGIPFRSPVTCPHEASTTASDRLERLRPAGGGKDQAQNHQFLQQRRLSDTGAVRPMALAQRMWFAGREVACVGDRSCRSGRDGSAASSRSRLRTKGSDSVTIDSNILIGGHLA
jgi:hypothetical protein